MKKKVLFFGDFGIDDTIALLYAQLTDKIDIIGIVADYGNVPKIEVIRNVRFLLKSVGKEYIKVFGGAEKPMTAEVATFYPDVHGKFGMGPIQPQLELEKFENFFEVISIIEKYKNEIIIVNTGRLTSLATLFLLYEDMMKNVHSYYIMGGAFLYPGNVTPIAEANFYVDPVAANVVMRYAQNLSIYPLNVTQHAIVTPEMVNYIHSKGKANFLKPLLDYYYYQFYQKKVPGIQGSPVHDALTMIAVNRDDIFTYYQSAVLVHTAINITRGLSLGDFRVTTEPETFDNRPKHRIAINLNYEQFFKEFMTVMTGELF
ncbi:nucleoside hydrolase [Ectobacillus panaciterrae]|uniref:nucleoside hydrolase n=1 Tax=Ectobacillus panaciterrae TaxID=363872 RepID=UPI0004089929|nr:nucleoside hydrolase [Ectobacillus panaciterrae]